jgi:agmatinase
MIRPTLLGLPYDASSSFLRGAAAAPSAIRAALASPSANMWTESGHDLGAPGALADAGDLVLPPTDDARGLIEDGVRRVVSSGARLLALGGDHSVTYPLMRAVGPMHPGVTLVQFDAHPDLYDNYEGNRYSHACPFARILEERLVGRLVQVGIRTMNGEQRAQASRFGVEVIDMRAWTAGDRPSVSGPVYVSLDIDVFDPAFAPGVSHREPGGLSVRDVLGVLESFAGAMIGADIVEYNPSQDVAGLTAPVCAKLVKELASHMMQR